MWIRIHGFSDSLFSLKEQGFLSNWVDDTIFTDDQLINGCSNLGRAGTWEMLAGYLNLRPYLDGLFEASKGTQCGDGLAGDSLKFGEFPATTAAIFQNALCIFPQLWNVHQCTRQNLNIRSSHVIGVKALVIFDIKSDEVSRTVAGSRVLKELWLREG